MSVLMPYLFLIAGLTLLYFGAEWLVDASSKLAIRLGVRPLLVGLTIVAFGTSAPELVVSVQSALAGVGSISVGNVVGSNVCNVALILGLSAIICPMLVSRQLFKFDIPAVLFASLLVWLFLNDGTVGIWEGVTLLALFTAYMVYTIISAKKNGGEGAEPATASDKKNSLAKNIVFIIAGLGLLVGGADLLVRGAVKLATNWGVSEAVIGLTIVALGTSLPELATSTVAAFKKQNEIAIGNIVGSNLFNILCILGVVGVMGPVNADGISPRDVLIMLALAVLLFLPLLTRRTLNRWEGVLFVGIYAAYIAVICVEVVGA